MTRARWTCSLAIAALAMVVRIGPIAAAETDEKEPSLSEVNKQLTNPVSSIWSLTFQFNNFILENDHWNHNMLFQPVLPISLTPDWNLINRPVIPLYNSVPHPVGRNRFRQTTAFGAIADAEMLSPAFAVAGQYMPVHPSEFGQEWNVQAVVSPVIPKLFKGTVFCPQRKEVKRRSPEPNAKCRADRWK